MSHSLLSPEWPDLRSVVLCSEESSDFQMLKGGVLDKHVANAILLGNVMMTLEALDNRQQAIAALRLFSQKKTTLDELGSMLSLTRERVRQIERGLIADLEPVLSNLRAAYIDEIDPTKSETGYICMLNELAPFGSRAIEKLGEGSIDFSQLGTKFELYEIEQGICFVPDKETVRNSILEWAKNKNQHGLFGIRNLPKDQFLLGSISETSIVRALELLNLTQLANGLWLQASSYVDAAVALLAQADREVSVEELSSQIDPSISTKSFRQRLMSDSRFAFPESGMVRLVAPGQDAVRPKSISELIGELVPEDGSSIELKTLIERVQSQRSAAESSIRAFASRYPFVLRRNLVFRSSKEVKRPKSQPARTKNLYKLPDGWAFRLTVNGEHLRGSSIPLPVSFVNAFNLSVESSLEFDDLQSQDKLWMNWDGSQPKARSIRSNLVSIGAEEGQEVMLLFCDGTFRASLIQQVANSGPEAIANLFPDLYGNSVERFLKDAFMCSELGGVPLLEAMKIRGEFDLIELFEG